MQTSLMMLSVATMTSAARRMAKLAKDFTHPVVHVNNLLGIFVDKNLQLERLQLGMLPGGVVRGRRNPLHFELAARLKTTRKAMGLSRNALCEAAGLADTVVAYIEEGARKPRTTTMVKLARVLGVAPGWLAYGLGSQAEIKAGDNGEGLTARLRALRVLRKLSRDSLAKASVVQAGAIQNIEEGRAAPRVDTIERLAVALDVSAAWLAFGEGEAPVALELPATTV